MVLMPSRVLSIADIFPCNSRKTNSPKKQYKLFPILSRTFALSLFIAFGLVVVGRMNAGVVCRL